MASRLRCPLDPLPSALAKARGLKQKQNQVRYGVQASARAVRLCRRSRVACKNVACCSTARAVSLFCICHPLTHTSYQPTRAVRHKPAVLGIGKHYCTQIRLIPKQQVMHKPVHQFKKKKRMAAFT